MSEMEDSRKIKCPKCLGEYPLVAWKAGHKQGELARVACPNCGWQPEGKMLAVFRGALATQSMLEDLRERRRGKVGA